jgi:hypothetical protein
VVVLAFEVDVASAGWGPDRKSFGERVDVEVLTKVGPVCKPVVVVFCINVDDKKLTAEHTPVDFAVLDLFSAWRAKSFFSGFGCVVRAIPAFYERDFAVSGQGENGKPQASEELGAVQWAFKNLLRH